MSRNKKNEELKEILVDVNRVTTVVSGGRIFSFAATVVVGDGKGRVGCGRGKAKEVNDAKAKAIADAKKKIQRYYLYENRTIYYDVTAKEGAAEVLLRRAKPGTGVIAGGAMRSLLDALGVRDIVAKSLRSNTPYLLILATLKALSQVKSPKNISDKRGLKLYQLSPISSDKRLVNSDKTLGA